MAFDVPSRVAPVGASSLSIGEGAACSAARRAS